MAVIPSGAVFRTGPESDSRVKLRLFVLESQSGGPISTNVYSGSLLCPYEHFSVQQPENTNTDGKLALLTRVPPHPTLGTLARSKR